MKVAVLGTSPHWRQAPFADPSWEIWGTNMLAAYGDLPRWDRWFELHNNASINTYPGHRDWLKAQERPVYLCKPMEDIPYGIEYPLAQVLKKYGTWFFTSSISYMLAMALEMPAVTEIGLYGVDLADTTEYRHQKPGCRFFIQVAQMAGVKVTWPAEAAFGMPGRLYCYDDTVQPLRAAMELKMAELRARAEQNQQNRTALTMRAMALKGALEINLPREALQEQLDGCIAAEAAAANDALVFDGGIQMAQHALDNWSGA